ncbi:MAG: hypothetical protein ACLU37_05965 [Collinsella sp.]
MHNPILLTAICAVVSFFIGAIPFGLILGRVFNHTDIRKAAPATSAPPTPCA